MNDGRYFVVTDYVAANCMGGLWRLNQTSGTWVLLSGSNTVAQLGTIPASVDLTENSTYLPGARILAALSYDPQGKYVFLYGGYGYSRTAAIGTSK